MKLLVSGATTVVSALAGDPVLSQHLGHLLTPENGNSMRALLETSLPIGVDNSCFKRFDPAAVLRCWAAVYGVPVLWCTLPDVVADAEATMRLFHIWRPVLRALDLPAALVAQDGLERLAVPWSDLDCLFIGGSTAWKEGPHAFALAREAKRRGLLVHVGRVNTERREALCWKMGADSFDGTQYSMFSRVYLRRCLQRLANPTALMEEIAREEAA